jgi:hypothetical protein
MIQKEMNMFNKHYRYILLSLPSGTVELEYIDKAAERFLEDEGRPFFYKDCVEVLHQLPKFDPMITAHGFLSPSDVDITSSSSSSSASSSTITASCSKYIMGSNFGS